MLGAHVGAVSTPESACELRSVVSDDISGYAVFADHMLEEHTCQFR